MDEIIESSFWTKVDELAQKGLINSSVNSTLHRPERPLRIGFVPLVDVAPIAYAEETGIFSRRGLRVELVREPGWATVRDKVAYGELEIVHAPVGLAFALSWGLGVLRQPCLTGWLLNSNGDAITISNQLRDAGVRDAGSLATVIQGIRPARPLTFGVPNLFSSHHFLLLHWFRPAGIVPGRDVQIVVLPPPLMAPCLAKGDIDGYCVGEPYNTLAVRDGSGHIVAESSEIVPLHPEKALVVSETFHDRDPEVHLELIRAIAESASVCETAKGREEVARILSQPRFLGMDESLIRSSLFANEEDGIASSAFHVFSHPEVNRPDQEKTNWLVTQLRLAGLLGNTSTGPLHAPHQILREDLYEASFATRKHVAKRAKSSPSRSRS